MEQDPQTAKEFNTAQAIKKAKEEKEKFNNLAEKAVELGKEHLETIQKEAQTIVDGLF